MSFFETVVLGIVQGVTEFLPISSTGHLILVRDLFAVASENALAFDAVLHLATAAAVVLYFRQDIWLLSQTILRKLGRLPVNAKDEVLLYALMAGTVPAVILGLLLEDIMGTLFRSPLLVAVVLVAGSLLFMYAEWHYLSKPRQSEMTVRKGLVVGVFQSLALIPGMSRSGASIVGGMLLGLTRHEAARFSFLLALPVILGAGSKKFLELMMSDGDIAWTAIALGACTAFVTGLLAIHFMLSFVRTHTLWPFIWYRIVLATFVVFVFVLS